MITENNLDFLKGRIFEIKSALLFSLSNELVKIPASIISVLKIDEEGHLWFFTNRPKTALPENDKVFPARLQFYRKGKPFYLQVGGIAFVDESLETIDAFSDVNKETENIAMKEMVLIKLKMKIAEYYEQKPQADHNSFVRTIFQNIYAAVFKPTDYYRSFELNTHAA